MRPRSLKATLDELVASLARAVLAEIRSTSADELLAEARRRGGRARGRGAGGTGGRSSARRAAPMPRGRLPRRSPEEIARTLDRVVEVVKTSRRVGMRAEEIREALSLDVRELPRVIKEGLKTGRLRARGRKRATTYFAW